MTELTRQGHDAVARSRRSGLDLLDRSAVESALKHERPDAIINCAAHVGSVHYVTSFAADVFHDNVQMALNLYKAVASSRPEALIVNPLSNCSYPGEADVHYEPEWWNGPVHDSVCSYGNAKRFIYVLSRCYHKQYKVRTMNFLVPNAFGPGDYTDPNKTHALNGMIIRMIQSQRRGDTDFEIWGTGKPVREWGFIKDIAAVLVRGLKLDRDLQYPINIAQNRGYAVSESARMIAQVVGFSGKLSFNTKFQDGAMRKVLDDRAFREAFPDFVFTNHLDGISQTVDYYQKQL